ncbi:hypothetical protein [Calothrix sp. NIES-2098]|uniref:hypothetical protein n=1 Tax=Calothrix sp. NIES-2098 TaxID=1954171 RepID=UPI000B61F7AD|nr:hypothetical protein NIES2098_52080 [Calothrix sp. NIES-2098]
MTLQAQVKQNSNCAIFSRNYSEHLDEAVEISSQKLVAIIPDSQSLSAHLSFGHQLN